MEWLGKLISCFVTERKHRQIKDAALHVFRHMEHTVLVDVVNQMCQQVVDGHDLFEKMFLVNPRPCKLQPEIVSSARAVLECGLVAKKDLLFFEDGTCGEVSAFFIISDVVFVEIRVLPSVGDVSLRDNSSTVSVFKECRHVVDAVIWHPTETENVLRACVPPVLIFQ